MDTAMTSKAGMFSPICVSMFKVSQKKNQMPFPHCGLFYLFSGVKHTHSKWTKHCTSISKGRQSLSYPLHGKTFWPHEEVHRTSEEAKIIYSQHLQHTSHGYSTSCCHCQTSIQDFSGNLSLQQRKIFKCHWWLHTNNLIWISLIPLLEHCIVEVLR